MQNALEVPDKVNSIFVSEAKPASGQGGTSLHDLLSPQLIDYGLVLKHVKRTFGERDKTETIYDYYSLSSERMLIEPAMEQVATKAFGGLGAQGVLTYLANNMERVEESGDRGGGTGDR